jgi:hypothetical protein
MARSPEKPPREGVETESLPWAPSPGSQDPLESATAVAEGFAEGPSSAEEAIGGGSHRPQASEQAREPVRSKMHETAAPATELRDALRGAIITQPFIAVAIAAGIGFLAALLWRR